MSSDVLDSFESEQERMESKRKFKPEKWVCNMTDFQRLVSKGFRIMDDMTTQERTALVIYVVQNKDITLLKAMLENGLQPYEICEIRGQRKTSWWLLLEAVAASEDDQECLDMVKYLLDNGCDVNGKCSPDNDECLRDSRISPLCAAVERDLWGIADLLMSYGANITPEVEEVFGASCNPRIIEILEKYDLKFQIDATEPFMRGLLGYGSCRLSKRKLEGHYMKYQIPMLKTLIGKGIKLPHQDAKGNPYSPICAFTAKFDSLNDEHMCDVLQLLLDYGEDINAVDSWGMTALHHAAQLHRDPVLELLIESGAEMNVYDLCRRTPLILLAECECGLKSLERFINLVNNKADVNAVTRKDTEVSHVLATCMNESFKYEKHVLFLLTECEIKVHSRLNDLYFEVFQPSIMYRLVQAGLSGDGLLLSVLKHALKAQTRKGYHLVQQVSPNNRGLLENVEVAENLKREGSALVALINAESRQPCPLVTWAIFTIRKHLIDVSGQISILPRLKRLQSEVTVHLRPMLTLECYMVDVVTEFERSLLTPDLDHEEMMCTYNRDVLQLSRSYFSFYWMLLHDL